VTSKPAHARAPGPRRCMSNGREVDAIRLISRRRAEPKPSPSTPIRPGAHYGHRLGVFSRRDTPSHIASSQVADLTSRRVHHHLIHQIREILLYNARGISSDGLAPMSDGERDL
jgi:hypothetical protein